MAFEHLEWLSPRALQVVTGLDAESLKDLRKRFGGGKTRGNGNSLEVHAPSLFSAWYAAYRRGGAAPVDPLERKRLADAELAEIKVQQARGELVDIQQFAIERLDPFCDELRKAIELLPAISQEAAQVMSDGLEAAKIRLLGHGERDDSTGT
jgi:hypothetical protein